MEQLRFFASASLYGVRDKGVGSTQLFRNRKVTRQSWVVFEVTLVGLGVLACLGDVVCSVCLDLFDIFVCC